MPERITLTPRAVLSRVLAISSMGVLTFSLISPALPDLADALGVDRSTIGLVNGAVAIPGIFLAIFIGYVADLKGRRFVAIASLLLFGFAGVAAYWARSFWLLIALRAIQGVGTSGVLSLGVVVIGDTYAAGTERTRALGLNGAAITITGLVSPALGGILATVDPFAPFLVFAVALPVAWWVRHLPVGLAEHEPSPPIPHVAEMFQQLKSRAVFVDFMLLLPFMVMVMVLFAGLAFTGMPLFLEQVFDLGPTDRGLVQTFVSIGSSAGALAAARLVARLGRHRQLVVSVVIVAAGFAGVAAAPSLWVVAPTLVVAGFGIGTAFPVAQDFVASAVPGAYRGAAVGTWISALRFGQAIGPVVATSAITGLGGRTALGVSAALGIGAAITMTPLRRLANRWRPAGTRTSAE